MSLILWKRKESDMIKMKRKDKLLVESLEHGLNYFGELSTVRE